jgi:hypothetical protein
VVEKMQPGCWRVTTKGLGFSFCVPLAMALPLVTVAFTGPGASPAASGTHTISVVIDMTATPPVEAVSDVPYSFAYTGRHDGGPLPAAPPTHDPHFDFLLAAIDVSTALFARFSLFG